jgi:hypothetical protein
VAKSANIPQKEIDAYLEALNKCYIVPAAEFTLSSDSSRLLKLSAKDPSPLSWPELIFKAARNLIQTLRVIIKTSSPTQFLHDGSVLSLGKALSCFTMITTCNRCGKIFWH